MLLYILAQSKVYECYFDTGKVVLQDWMEPPSLLGNLALSKTEMLEFSPGNELLGHSSAPCPGSVT